MEFLENVSLRNRNSLRLDARARWYCEVCSIAGLRQAAAFANDRGLPLIMLGEGTNVVLTADLDALIVRNRLGGLSMEGDRVIAASGENWHRLVAKAVARGLFGIENLALIPGTAGAAPMQNIGAYGVELADTLIGLTALHYPSNEMHRFSKRDCRFGYRNSRFRREPEWIVTEIELKLHRTDNPVLTYPGVLEYLEIHRLAARGRHVFRAVSEIRKSKLPDPVTTPNAGSFFKNPIVPVEQAAGLAGRFPDMPRFEESAGVKLSAAWLIEQAGLKGKKRGGFAVSGQHALVVVNEGSGGADELVRLIGDIRRQVRRMYGVTLEVEPRIYPDGAG